MKKTTVLFDLDGTLLPFEQDEFIKEYFSNLAKKIVPMGHDKDLLIKSVWAGTDAMVRNDGKVTNEEAFKIVFSKLMDVNYDELEPVFLDFYQNEFDKVKCILKEEVNRLEAINSLKEKGFRVVLATNPLFPRVAVETRLNWIGLKMEDFEFITTFENSHYCKPNLDYYREIFEKIGVEAEKCIMVGNNTLEDMVPAELGVKTYLADNYIENSKNLDIEQFDHASFDEIIEKILNM